MTYQSSGSPARERVATRCVCCDGCNLSSSPAILMPFVADRALGYAPVRIDPSWGLKTVQQGMAHSICKSLLCRDCGHLFLDIRFSDREMAALYDDYRGSEYTALREYYEPGYRERNDRLVSGTAYANQVDAFLKPHVPMNPRVLDWGGDTGRNSPFARERKSLDIYDISEVGLVEGARRVSRAMIDAEAYDLVVCSNVLEHVPFPLDVLHEIRGALTPETTLYIEVPCEELMRDGRNDDVHLRKKHWHEHVNFFSRNSLEALIKRSALAPLEIRTGLVPTEISTNAIFMLACRLRDG